MKNAQKSLHCCIRLPGHQLLELAVELKESHTLKNKGKSSKIFARLLFAKMLFGNKERLFGAHG